MAAFLWLVVVHVAMLPAHLMQLLMLDSFWLWSYVGYDVSYPYLPVEQVLDDAPNFIPS
jgi:hypothetical protein